MTKRAEDSWAYAVAVIAGALLWQATAMLSGRREAWDSPLYWMTAYPLGILVAAILAYLNPDRPWRWALALMWAQPVVMAITSRSGFGLLPLGLIMFGFLAIPPIAVAGIAGRLTRRRQTK
jgi:hypothetical protein